VRSDAVRAAAFLGGLLIAQQVAGRALRDALFLSSYSVSSLPGIMLASALVSVCGALAFAAALARRPPGAVLTGALLLQAGLLAGEWGLAAGQPRLAAAALYVQLALLGPGIVSGFWSLVNERFDPHTARRVVGEIGTGASVGGVVGGALAWIGARILPLPALLLALAATSVLAVFALPWLRSEGEAETREGGEAPVGVLSALSSIRQFPYLRQLASIVVLGALAEVLLDYLLKAGAARAFADSGALARFFGLFYAGVALLTLAVQAGLTRRSLERVGLAGTVSVQPAALALVSAAGLLLPSLSVAAAARGLGGEVSFRSASPPRDGDHTITTSDGSSARRREPDLEPVQAAGASGEGEAVARGGAQAGRARLRVSLVLQPRELRSRAGSPHSKFIAPALVGASPREVREQRAHPLTGAAAR